MRAAFVTDGLEAPASRFRVQQFFPAFRAAGVDCTLAYAYGSAYNRVFRRPLVGTAYKLACAVRRAAFTLASARYDVVVLQRTALPHTALPEVLRGKYGSPLVFDFDDALWIGADLTPSRLRDRAFRAAVRAADHVVAGNAWLAERADAPQKTTVIPTVIDVDRYVPAQRREDDGTLVIGWMGSATNFVMLRYAMPGILAALDVLPRARLRIVANAVLPELAGHPRIEQLPWSAATEVELLQSFDIGLMPLEDTEVSRGKCGFKMIQYMAVGCPVVASSVGANVEIFGTSEPGFLVAPHDTFRDALVRLGSDGALRRCAGAVGRARAVEAYSVAAAAPQHLAILRSLGAA